MNRRIGLTTLLAAGGLMLASQQAGAVVVLSDTTLADVGPILGATEHFSGSPGYIYEAVADLNDNNQFASIGVADDNGFAGWSSHVDAGDVAFLNGGSFTEGMAVRMSAWVMSNPNDPFSNTSGEDGFRIEFLNTPLGDGQPGSPDLITASPLSPVSGGLLTTGWIQKSLTVEMTNAVHDFSNLAEIRPVLAQAGGVGASGELFADNYVFEVFPNLATANSTALPNNMPGGFEFDPPPDLSGDITGDGFVGIADLNIVLGNWNAGTPPTSHESGVLLSDFSNFNLSGTYADWGSASFTSGPDDFTVVGGDFGGGWFTLPATVDATGMTTIELQLDINPGNVATKFNVVLFDADGTQAVYRWDPVAIGDNQTLLKDLGDILQFNATGSVPGLDISAITEFHLQGSFDNTPSQTLDLTFDNLALIPGGVGIIEGDINGDGFVGIADLTIVLGTWNNGTPPGGAAVPEPATLSLLALGGLAMLRRR